MDFIKNNINGAMSKIRCVWWTHLGTKIPGDEYSRMSWYFLRRNCYTQLQFPETSSLIVLNLTFQKVMEDKHHCSQRAVPTCLSQSLTAHSGSFSQLPSSCGTDLPAGGQRSVWWLLSDPLCVFYFVLQSPNLASLLICVCVCIYNLFLFMCTAYISVWGC